MKQPTTRAAVELVSWAKLTPGHGATRARQAKPAGTMPGAQTQPQCPRRRPPCSRPGPSAQNRQATTGGDDAARTRATQSLTGQSSRFGRMFLERGPTTLHTRRHFTLEPVRGAGGAARRGRGAGGRRRHGARRGHGRALPPWLWAAGAGLRRAGRCWAHMCSVAVQ